MKAIVRRKRAQDAAGKSSVFKIRNTIITQANVESYLSKKNMTTDDAGLASPSLSAIAALECFTPAASQTSPVQVSARATQLPSGASRQHRTKSSSQPRFVKARINSWRTIELRAHDLGWQAGEDIACLKTLSIWLTDWVLPLEALQVRARLAELIGPEIPI